MIFSKCLDYWKYLENKFFSKLDQGFFETIRKLELSIKKYYVVNCIQTGRVDRCREFFDNYANELAKDKEWRDWFGKISIFADHFVDITNSITLSQESGAATRIRTLF